MTSENKIKAILVTRHELMPVQKATLEQIAEIVEVVPQIPTEPQQFQEFVRQVKAKGAEAIVSVGLPLPIIVQLKQAGLRVILSKQEAIFTGSEEEAKKIQAEKPEVRFVLTTKSGEKSMARVLEFKGWVEIEKVEVVEKPLITV